MSQEKPLLEIVFKKGRPVAAFFRLHENGGARSGLTIPIRPAMTAHYNAKGLPIGLELVLPTQATLQTINEALRELGSAPVEASDIIALAQ